MEELVMAAATARLCAISLLLVTMNANDGVAEDCSFLNRDPLTLRDRELLFQVKGSNTWSSIDDNPVNLPDQTISFAYVIRETIDPARSGVVVLKSGRTRGLNEPQQSRQSKKVMLVRHAATADNKLCGVASGFGEHSISAKSYDDFHDQGLRVPDAGTLQSFHIKYAARNNRCRRTDDNGADSLVPPD